MKERLLQLLELEQLTPSRFADLIGVQRSSVSHVLSGRNKPSFDFLEKTLQAFPGMKADWLMLGKGSMYEQMGRNQSGNLFEQDDAEHSENEEINFETDASGTFTTPGEPKEVAQGDIKEESKDREPESAENTRRVKQVMVFYDDDTFSTYFPSSD
jgi:transcriptional regulator with XRE-family HTH domain